MAGPGPGDEDKLAGQPADVAPSAYLYRADRRAEDNPPEAWVLLMQHANLPFDQPVDTKAPAVRQVLVAFCGKRLYCWQQSSSLIFTIIFMFLHIRYRQISVFRFH
jgi:hypothetical protein